MRRITYSFAWTILAVTAFGPASRAQVTNFTSTWSGDSNTWYHFTASTNLTDWSVLQTVLYSSNEVKSLTDVESSNYPARFYRTVPSPVPPPSFGIRMGGLGTDVGRSVALDPAENIFVVGNFQGTVNFGLGNLPSSGTTEIFLVKYNSSGQIVWARRYGGTGAETPRKIRVDQNGDVTMAGSFTGISDFRETTGNPNSCKGGVIPYSGSLTATDNDAFIAVYDSSGVCVWARKLGGISADFANDLATDLAGNICLVGSFSTNANLGGASEFPIHGPGTNAFIAKYEPLGGNIWAQAFEMAGPTSGDAIEVDSSGNLIVGFNFAAGTNGFYRITPASTNFTSILNLPTNGPTFLLAKFTPGTTNVPGTMLWWRYASFPANVPGTARITSLSVDNGGSVYISGVFSNSIHLGGNDNVFADRPATTNTMTALVATNAFIAKYSASGDCLWTKVLSGTSNNLISATCIDTNGFLSAAGFFTGDLTVDGAVVSSGGTNDLFISKFSPSGIHQWTRTFGGTNDLPLGIAANVAGGLNVVGQFRGTNVMLGPIVATSTNNSIDGFLIQLDPGGGVWPNP